MEYYAKLFSTKLSSSKTKSIKSPVFGTREETNHWVYEKLKSTKMTIGHVEIHSEEYNEDNLITLHQIEYFYEW